MQKIALLYDASQAVLSTFDLDEVLQRILVIARDYFHIDRVALLLLDEEKRDLFVRSHIGGPQSVEHDRATIGIGLTGTAALQKRPIYAPDVSKDLRYISNAPETRSELAIPLMVRDEVVGVLDCQSSQLNHFDNETIDLLMMFSTQASMALQNARLYNRERERANQLQLINAIAVQANAVLDPEELFRKACALIQELFGVDHVCVLLSEDGHFSLRAHHGSLTPAVREGQLIPDVQAGFGPLSGLHVHLESNLQELPALERVFEEAVCRVSTPLVSRGRSLGTLMLLSGRADVFRNFDRQPLDAVAGIFAAAIQNADYVERVKQLAYLDGLTGIFNRRYFEMRIAEEMERSHRYHSALSLLMLDFDHFKRLNDEFGHLFGDEILRQVCSLLSGHLRKFDTIARYGGEEFAILLPQTTVEQATAVAEKLRNLIANWQFPGVPRPVTVSFGVAALPAHGHTRDTLVGAADAALYAAKLAGRNCVMVAKAKSAAAQACADYDL